MAKKNSGDSKSKGLALPLEAIREGRDEMNLVEYPFASLWKNTEADAEISHEWETQHPLTGRKVKASWRVSGDPKLGLPSASDEQVYLALMEVTQQSGLESQTVYFTRHDLIRRLGWVHNDVNYRRLLQAMRRLKAVTISAENAFWDASAKSFRSVGFSILDNYDIATERPGRKKSGQSELPLSFFKWNDVVFSSMKAGYIRAIDLGFALSLQSALALRLYRYLDKKSYDSRRKFEIELGSLCERHLGMRPSEYASKYKERLKPAHDELLARGFLEHVGYEPMKTKKAEKVCYTFAPRKNLTASTPDAPTTHSSNLNTPQDSQQDLQEASQSSLDALDAVEAAPTRNGATVLITHSLFDSSTNSNSNSETDELLHRMIDIGVSPDVAHELIRLAAKQDLRLQLDCLTDRDPKDSAATFVKAVRESWTPPTKYSRRIKAAEQARQRAVISETEKISKAAKERLETEKKVWQEADDRNIDAIWDSLSAEDQATIETKVREILESNEFLRARLNSGKLTTQSPDWIHSRRELVRKLQIKQAT
jgi:hypothetical protein